MGMDNIFMHDAVPTWSGFLYQGRIAVYLAVRKINELREAGNESEIKKYALEMEKCEDIAVVYMDGNNKKYHSIHQVKNEKGCKLASYKDPLIQLMLEKGVCRKNNYGTPAAYLHISKEINYESESMNGHALECLKNWKADILKFYNDLSVTYDSFVGNEVTLKRLLDLMKNNTKTIGINREEYKKKYSELKKMCNDALEDIGSDNFRNEQMIKYTLLCMNQAYGAHKACSILLIDDPVQTIDDVNMVGLVDILRYGFGDRQIFISTHEQSFEWFLRYRYSKAGKNVKIFNMKDIMLQEE